MSAPTVALIGATGRVGVHVLRGAVARGYRVRALARDPARLEAWPSVTPVKGSVLDPGAVRELVSGVDVVLSCLGSRPKELPVVAPGTRALVAALDACAPRPRLVHLSSLGVGDSYRQCRRLSWLFARVAIPLLAKVFADMEAAEQVLQGAVRSSTAIARPTILRDRGGPQGYVCRSPDERPGALFIARPDVAAFFLDATVDSGWDGRAVSLFSARGAKPD